MAKEKNELLCHLQFKLFDLPKPRISPYSLFLVLIPLHLPCFLDIFHLLFASLLPQWKPSSCFSYTSLNKERGSAFLALSISVSYISHLLKWSAGLSHISTNCLLTYG